MSPIRKFIGFFIAALIGIPVLFGTIIAVGISNAVVTPEVMSDMPREIIEELPDVIDDIYNAMILEEDIDDDKARVILDSMKRSGTTPRKVMEESGMFEWLREELSDTLRQFGEVLRGERVPGPIRLQLEPLKQAILHPAMTSYLKSLIKSLPECRDTGLEEWKRLAFTNDWSDGFDLDQFPECRPAGIEITDEMVMMFQQRAVEEMPDEEEIMDDWEDIPRGWNITRTVSAVTYTLFIFPALFIFLGSLIAATSKSSFFRWSGVSTMIGGLLAYGMASLLNNLIPVTEFGLRYNLADSFSSRFEEVVVSKTASLTEIFMNSLFGPASKLGGTVAVIGLILFALAFLINDDRKAVAGE